MNTIIVVNTADKDQVTRDTIREYKKVKQARAELEKQEKKLHDKILSLAKESGCTEKNWSDCGFTISEYDKDSFDSKAFKEALPDFYEHFSHKTHVVKLVTR